MSAQAVQIALEEESDLPGTTVTVSACSNFEVERAIDSVLLGTAGTWSAYTYSEIVT